jgi:hypothetical protein
MTIEQLDVVDITAFDKASGDVWLTISDHLPWDKNEGHHLVLLQNKLNAYLSFIESGEIFRKVPNAEGRKIVITIVGKFPLSEKATRFLQLASGAIERAGFRLQFKLMQPN